MYVSAVWVYVLVVSRSKDECSISIRIPSNPAVFAIMGKLDTTDKLHRECVSHLIAEKFLTQGVVDSDFRNYRCCIINAV